MQGKSSKEFHLSWINSFSISFRSLPFSTSPFFSFSHYFLEILAINTANMRIAIVTSLMSWTAIDGVIVKNTHKTNESIK